MGHGNRGNVCPGRPRHIMTHPSEGMKRRRKAELAAAAPQAWVTLGSSGMFDLSGFPIVRVAVQMHDRHYDNLICQNPEQNPVGKSLGETSTDIQVHNGIQEWIDLNLSEGVLHRGQKTFAKVIPLRLLMDGGVHHFRFRFGMEANRLHARVAKAFLKTASASRSCTVP